MDFFFFCAFHGMTSRVVVDFVTESYLYKVLECILREG